MKRLVDLTLSIIGMVLVSPLFLIIGMLIKLDSKGSVFYRGERVGKGEKIFRIYKFRSMKVGIKGRGITSRDDERITRIGKILRKTKLDELPQLINVIKGEMSLVGPRPEDPEYYERGYGIAQREITKVLPGITSPASIKYRNEEKLLAKEGAEEEYLQHILPRKQELDLEYASGNSVPEDLRIIFQTLTSILSRNQK